MSVIQQLQKLRRMSADEIRVRLRGALRQRKERRLWARHRLTAHQPTRINEEQFLSDVAAIVPGTSRRALDRLTSEASSLRTEISSQSESSGDSIMSGAWEMLGHPFDLAGDVDWHRDPRTGHEFPRVFYADVPLHQDVDDGVDVKYVWELGRLQFLPELARSWQFSRNEDASANARRLLLSWIDQNPIYEGVHWTSGLEVAVRAISWIWTLAPLADWDGWQDGDLDRIAASLAEHATYLENHFSFYSSPYNHLVGEATGLYLISQVLRQLPDAGRWLAKARNVLEEHGPKQFYSDGFCVEQATGYHFFSLGFLAMAIVAARREGTPLERVERAVHTAFRTGILFQQPNGRWPAIGDVDSARAIPVHHDDFWDFASLCSLGAVLFDDPQLKRPDSQPGEELYWLLGGDGIDHFNTIETTQPDGFTHLPESGYAIARQGGDWFCFDAGPIAHGLHSDATPSTAHGHLDTLQVLYCHDGKPILIDPGMPFYFQDREWVRHFRSAAAHATIEIDGLPIAKDAGRLEWSHVAMLSPQLECRGDVDGWLARGVINFSPPQHFRKDRWERHVLALPGKGLWILDWFDLAQARSISRKWPLAKGIRVHTTEHGFRISPSPDHSLLFQSLGNACSVRCSHFSGESESPRGWTASGYGDFESTHVIAEEIELAGPAWVLTQIRLGNVHVDAEVNEQQGESHIGEGLNTLSTRTLQSGPVTWHIANGDGPPERGGNHVTQPCQALTDTECPPQGVNRC